MNPNVDCRLLVMMMCQCRFISRNKYTTLVGDVDHGEGYACVGIGNKGKSIYLSRNFAVHLIVLRKTVFKKKLLTLKLNA